MAINDWEVSSIEPLGGASDPWAVASVDPLDAEPAKDDSFFSLDRAKETALDVVRLFPGLEDLGARGIRPSRGRKQAMVVPRRGADNLPAIGKDLKLSAPEKKPTRRPGVAALGG